MSIHRKYSNSIDVPVFGVVPLNLREFIEELKQSDCALWAQFFKYGICGIFSSFILIAILALFHWLNPNYIANDLPKEILKSNMRIALFVAFIPANLFAYFTNRWLVFSPGKLPFWREMVLFTLISGTSFAGGEVGKNWMINLGYANWIAVGAFAASSAMVNFVARKFFVFSK